MRVPIQVLVYPVKQNEDCWEYLLLKRTEDRGGFWQGVTGHPEGKESIELAAARELLEETGFIPSFILKTDFTYFIPLKDSDKENYPEGTGALKEYVFVARINQDDLPSIDSLEHTEWKWCSYDEAIKLLHWEDNKKALDYVKKFLEE
ncbi:MAG: NUDIX hydrolase [Candidatus Heimdallarchaeaceae archaeon]